MPLRLHTEAGDFWVVCFCQTTWDYLCNTAPHCCVFSSQHGQQQQQQQQQQVNRNSQEDKEKEEKEKEAERDEEKNDTEDKEDGMKWVAINLKKKEKKSKLSKQAFSTGSFKFESTLTAQRKDGVEWVNPYSWSNFSYLIFFSKSQFFELFHVRMQEMELG